MHPYLSINTTYTKPQHHNKLFNLQKSKTQGVILEKSIPLPQKDSKSCQKQSRIEGKPLTNGEEGQRRHSRHWKALIILIKPELLILCDTRRPQRVLIQTPCNQRSWILRDRSFPWIPNLAEFHKVEGEIWVKQEWTLSSPGFFCTSVLNSNRILGPPFSWVPSNVECTRMSPPGPPEGLFRVLDLIPPYGPYSSNLFLE